MHQAKPSQVYEGDFFFKVALKNLSFMEAFLPRRGAPQPYRAQSHPENQGEPPQVYEGDFIL